MSLMSSLRIYLTQARIARCQRGLHFDISELAKYYFAWNASLRPGATPLRDQSPWMTFAAINFLCDFLKPSMSVFESGSGGSTIFFVQRVRELVTVEHDPGWIAMVREALAHEGLTNCDLRLIEPTPSLKAAQQDSSDPMGYVSSDEAFGGKSFLNYASAVDEFGDGYFDVVIVDGRARPSCAWHAIPKVRPGGAFVLDNAERAHYREIHALLDVDEWHKHDLGGPGPYNRYFWQTCIWERSL
jgi:predicted O-methyltransferase YrrM